MIEAKNLTKHYGPQLATALTADNVVISRADGGALEISGLTAEHIGDRARDLHISLHELTMKNASLEEAFMEMTHEPASQSPPSPSPSPWQSPPSCGCRHRKSPASAEECTVPETAGLGYPLGARQTRDGLDPSSDPEGGNQ